MQTIQTEMYNRVQKVWGKLHKLRKSCNHKRNIKGIYNKQLDNNCLQQLPTLTLKTFFAQKNHFYSYFVEIAKKDFLVEIFSET